MRETTPEGKAGREIPLRALPQSITPASQSWNETLLCVLEPRPFESLWAFLVRLDEVNGFDAGVILGMIRRFGAGPAILGRPGDLLSGQSFNLIKLASLVDCDVTLVQRLTGRGLLMWLLGRTRARGYQLGQAHHYQICPVCVAVRQIPLTSMFENVSGCARHHVSWALECSCGARIEPFRRQRPFTCHACGMPYEAFSARKLTPIQVRDVEKWTCIYGEFLAWSAISPLDVSSLELTQAAESVAARKSVSLDRTMIARIRGRGKGPSLNALAALLHLTDSSVYELVAAAAEGTDVRLKPRARARTSCPNPQCSKGVVWRNGRLCGAQAYLCGVCGTSFRAERVFFSFDRVPGYPAWRAARNETRLHHLHDSLETVLLANRSADRVPTQDELLRAAGVPRSTSYLTPRAGLTELVRDAKREWKAQRVATTDGAAPGAVRRPRYGKVGDDR